MCIRRADSVYMVPPFLAYYGVLTGNETLVQEAYQQVWTIHCTEITTAS